jgi:hypothetical protein
VVGQVSSSTEEADDGAEADGVDGSDAAAVRVTAATAGAKVRRLPYSMRKRLHRQRDLQRRARNKKRLLKRPMEPWEEEACRPDWQRREQQQKQQLKQKHVRRRQQKMLLKQRPQKRKLWRRQQQQQQQQQKQKQQKQKQQGQQCGTGGHDGGQQARALAWIKRLTRRQHHQVRACWANNMVSVVQMCGILYVLPSAVLCTLAKYQ